MLVLTIAANALSVVIIIYAFREAMHHLELTVCMRACVRRIGVIVFVGQAPLSVRRRFRAASVRAGDS